MTEDLSARRCRELAAECYRNAKNALSLEVREKYERMAKDWLERAEEHEPLRGGGTYGTFI